MDAVQPLPRECLAVRNELYLLQMECIDAWS